MTKYKQSETVTVFTFQECPNWPPRRSGRHQERGGGEQEEDDEEVQEIAFDICTIHYLLEVYKLWPQIYTMFVSNVWKESHIWCQ